MTRAQRENKIHDLASRFIPPGVAATVEVSVRGDVWVTTHEESSLGVIYRERRYAGRVVDDGAVVGFLR